ncbi:hypothetical protein D3C76_1614500 [compost metagenome]
MNMIGTTTARLAKGDRPKCDTTSNARYDASTMKSPWAMLTRRITPKISESPTANMA